MARLSARIGVVGGGITGLAAAHRLLELDHSIDITLLESGSRLGGILQTVQNDGFSVEYSADNFITNVPWALDLCRRIGFEEQLLQTNSQYRQAFVVHKGRLQKIPEGFLIVAPSRIWPVMTTPILSLRGKLRLACEYWIPPANAEQDESLASFATRRLGREAYERLVQPLVGAIYTADPEKLSVKAALPRFSQMEREHGSLIRAARREQKTRGQDTTSSGARYSMFMAPRDGLSSLVQAIAARLPAGTVRLNSTVEKMKFQKKDGWTLSIGGGQPERLKVDAVIVATPSHQTTRLMADVDRELAGLLERIPHSACAIVSLGYRRDQIGHPLDGFGFVVPAAEGRRIMAGSFSSVKFADRAPAGCELIRVFVGGARQSELVELPDKALRELVATELGELLSISGDPVFDSICRWPTVMPQYHLGHCDLIDRIEARAAKLPGLALAGNWTYGVGIPHCIHSGESAAERTVSEM